ncbi:hypothetical protein VaNZ11_016022, partial [Volvox africanus]
MAIQTRHVIILPDQLAYQLVVGCCQLCSSFHFLTDQLVVGCCQLRSIFCVFYVLMDHVFQTREPQGARQQDKADMHAYMAGFPGCCPIELVLSTQRNMVSTASILAVQVVQMALEDKVAAGAHIQELYKDDPDIGSMIIVGLINLDLAKFMPELPLPPVWE